MVKVCFFACPTRARDVFNARVIQSVVDTRGVDQGVRPECDREGR